MVRAERARRDGGGGVGARGRGCVCGGRSGYAVAGWLAGCPSAGRGGGFARGAGNLSLCVYVCVCVRRTLKGSNTMIYTLTQLASITSISRYQARPLVGVLPLLSSLPRRAPSLPPLPPPSSPASTSTSTSSFSFSLPVSSPIAPAFDESIEIQPATYYLPCYLPCYLLATCYLLPATADLPPATCDLPHRTSCLFFLHYYYYR